MGDLYASAVGTTVLQIKEIPPCPTEYDGKVCLFDLADGVNEASIEAALSKFGSVKHCEVGTSAIVHFATHEAALAAKQAGPIAGVCAGIDTVYNAREYDNRGW